MDEPDPSAASSLPPELMSHLRSLLPETGARLLVGGAAAAAQLGGEVVAVPADRLGELAAASFAAALLLAGLDDRPLRPLFEEIRRLLADKGRFLILRRGAAPSAPPTPRELTIALSEAGFVIVKVDDRAAPMILARKEAFFVRAYRNGDEEQILPLFQRSFYVNRSRDRFRWEYQENPYGNRMISEAFAEDGRLVAHYAGYPVRFYSEVRGEPRIYPALQVGDTMTEPSVRQVGRGPTSLLGRTVRHYYARFCEGQVAFNYGVNTGNIQRFSMSFVGARRLEPLPYHVRDARTPVPVLRPSLARLAGYRIERFAHFDERWDELFGRVRGAYRLLLERDARYLEWRYARCPDAEYFLWAVFRRSRLVGWSVFRHRGDRGERLAWGDALFDPRHPAALPLLLRHVLAAPEHRSAETVETWLTSRPAWWSERVRALGFESRPEPQDLGFVFVPFEVDSEEDFRAALYYTMGDSDLF
ncbi:MAG TPA: GNAT family N-acetyltransferase [Thermoanaerobaculia bacterium]|nr:GNAT family N-acetyltransferase [Thermoanaerobaculia bacterium]